MHGGKYHLKQQIYGFYTDQPMRTISESIHLYNFYYDKQHFLSVSHRFLMCCLNQSVPQHF